MRRGDMGIATLIIFVVIILVATVAAVVTIQAANAARTQAQGTSEESRSKIGKRLVPDVVYFIVDRTGSRGRTKKWWPCGYRCACPSTAHQWT